ncbi:DUF6193 family natural product biosynthesis protein [Streptomyces sp. HNM0663]|uniref:DUF6193 family natural product biosynthesis protein n=1 Tax=Streptomyces chengmaiensis TaxID=3040919 RepID=A0ABT6HM51_9ACTN|nr:DUF6193 family natural product biosynthesis protein [Streptomyces chengmaiensis]MDH2389357.1 DUF6193 family natural product biosynthesis protein [Streptomyces chengmaiensis]
MTDIVEAQWQELLAPQDKPHWLQESLTELVRAAYEQPRLRALYPWTGMWELHFSRCTEPRFTWDIPYAGPSRDGGYRVDGPSRSQHVGEAATAREAIAMVLGLLPPGCGSAFIGTAEELAAYERTQDTR